MLSTFFCPPCRHAVFPDGVDFVDFAAYLSTDLIQPGIINVVRILMPMSVWPRLPSVSISLADGVTVAAGATFRQDWPQASAITGALIFTLACAATMFTTSIHSFLSRVQFRAPVSVLLLPWLCHGAGGVRTDKRDQVDGDITSIVLIAPIIGPLSGAALITLCTGKSFLPSLRLWVLSHCWLTAGDARDGEARRGSV